MVFKRSVPDAEVLDFLKEKQRPLEETKSDSHLGFLQEFRITLKQCWDPSVGHGMPFGFR